MSKRIPRRAFLAESTAGSLSLVALSSMPPAAAQRRPQSASGALTLTEVPETHYSLEVLAPYLTQYVPPKSTFPEAGDWTAVYDIIAWIGSPPYGKGFYRTNRVMGALSLTRRLSADGIVHEVHSSVRLSGRREDVIDATVQHAASGNSPEVERWDVEFRSGSDGADIEGASLREQGTCADGVLEVRAANHVRRETITRPLLTHWGVLDVVRSMRPQAAGVLAFDMFLDLSACRPDQRLFYDNRLELTFGDDTLALNGFVQTGTGIEPAHYWVDEKRRPLLVTYGQFGMALKGIKV